MASLSQSANRKYCINLLAWSKWRRISSAFLRDITRDSICTEINTRLSHTRRNRIQNVGKVNCVAQANPASNRTRKRPMMRKITIIIVVCLRVAVWHRITSEHTAAYDDPVPVVRYLCLSISVSPPIFTLLRNLEHTIHLSKSNHIRCECVLRAVRATQRLSCGVCVVCGVGRRDWA